VPVVSDATPCCASSSKRSYNYSDLEPLQSLLQEHIADHFEYISAVRLSQEQPAELCASNMYAGWAQFAVSLKALGFDLDATCPWKFLGLGKDEGPEPSMDMIEQRVRFATSLTLACMLRPWAGAVTDCINALITKLENCRMTCVSELEGLVRRRRRMRKETWPRWLELEMDFITFLTSRLSSPLGVPAVLSQLSNLQGLDFYLLPNVYTPAKSRTALNALTCDARKGAEFLTSFAQGSLIMWGPPHHDTDASTRGRSTTFHHG